MAYPDLDWPESPDAIDALIAALNEAMGVELAFERDVLDVDRPEDWGAVEMTNVINEAADGKIIDQCYELDVWACVSDRSSEWLRRIETVFDGFGDSLHYHLYERAYLHDLKKVLWRWKVILWPAVPAAPSGTMEQEEANSVPVEQEEA